MPNRCSKQGFLREDVGRDVVVLVEAMAGSFWMLFGPGLRAAKQQT